MKELNKDEFLNAIKSENLTIVDFYADWCQPCKILTPNLEKVSEDFKDVNFYKFNVDTDKNLAIGLGISSIPTTIFYKNNNELHRAIGVAPVDKIIQEVEEHL